LRTQRILESVRATTTELARSMQSMIAMPNSATATDVNRLLGDVDPLVLERILETGATPDEVAEALRVVEQERGFGEEPHVPSSPRVAEVRAVLDELTVLDGDVLPEEDELR
jgi:hypothetical protein